MFPLAFLIFAGTAFATLQVASPVDTVYSSTSITITWTSSPGDPDFSIELTTTTNGQIALANNVDPSLNTITLTLPVVPENADYSIQFVNIANINDVYSSTGPFSIQNAITTSTPSTSTSPTSTTPAETQSTGSTTANATTRSTSSGTRTSSSTSTLRGSSTETGPSAASATDAAVKLGNSNGAALVVMACALALLGVL